MKIIQEIHLLTFHGLIRVFLDHHSNTSIHQQGLEKENVLEIFESFFTDELIQIIVNETNRHAEQFLEKNKDNIKRRSRVKNWRETNCDEIRTFLGLLILQGICSKPESTMYFSNRESIETPFYKRIISEERFHLLQKFLHFANNEEINDRTINRKLFKIAPILNYLRNKFMNVYKPKQNVSIDESLIRWKGRLTWRQYIPSKR